MSPAQAEQLRLVRTARADLQQYHRIVRDQVAQNLRILARQEQEIRTNANATVICRRT